MTEREALKLALEALQDYVDEYGPWSDDSGAQYVLRVGKEALAQPEQPKVRTGNCLRVGVCASEGHKIAPQRKPLTDEEIWKFWWSRPEVPDGEDDSMEAEFVAAVRRVLAAHGIKGEA